MAISLNRRSMRSSMRRTRNCSRAAECAERSFERQVMINCKRVAPIRTGEAVSTPAFNLDAKIIIHTAGPIWRGGSENEVELLKSCYTNSLALAREQGCRSIAFPLISSGIYGVPFDVAMDCARSAIETFLSADDSLMVYLVLY